MFGTRSKSSPRNWADGRRRHRSWLHFTDPQDFVYERLNTVPAPEVDAQDFLSVLPDLPEEERLVRDSVARFVDERVLPVIREHFDNHTFPAELVPELASLGLLGSSLQGYGCAGLGPLAYGLICEELERGDSGIRSFVSVQSSLCMFPIHAYGSEAQRQRFLPAMAKGELIGCFGLTEPHGCACCRGPNHHAAR